MAGLIFTGTTAVEPRGRISPLDLGLWKDEHICSQKSCRGLIKEFLS